MAKDNPAERGEPSPPVAGNKKEHKHLHLLSFLNGSVANSWKKVEEKFHGQVEDGKLSRDKFGACIGLNEDSKYFAHELFDVLSKRKKVEPEKGITLQQLRVFWEELNKDDLDTRLEIFFDLCDKNDDNKISKEEVETVLKWTASANKLTSIEKQIESYASMIVKELDPDGNGFIEWSVMGKPSPSLSAAYFNPQSRPFTKNNILSLHVTPEAESSKRVDTRRFASENADPKGRWIEGIPHQMKRRTSDSENAGPKGKWIVRSHLN